MQTPPYDPIRELQRMESEFDMFISHDDWQHTAGPHDASSVDMYVEGDQLVAEFAMPQFKKADIKATVGQHVLEVTAAHHETSQETEKQYFHHESSSQYFRRVSLPPGTDTSNLHASFRHGLLRVTMPFQHDKKGTDIAIE